MAKRFKPPSHGIEIWEGQPGAGKSYSGVEYILNKALKERRPVYTNLPIRFRVLRQHLRNITGDDKLAGYVMPIDFVHFEAFIERNHEFTEFVEPRKKAGVPISRIEREFLEEYGPHVYDGEDANWLYPTALLVFDEFHRWCDQRYQQDEHPGFLTYATMHRHHMHKTILLTQDQMQIPITWRRNKATVIRVANLSNLPMFGAIRMPQILRFSEYPAEVSDSTDRHNVKPVRTWIKVPAWDGGGLIFRLYDSFSHVGSPRRMLKIREEVRNKIEGVDPMADKKDQQPKIKKKRKQWWRPIAATSLVVGVVYWLFFSGGGEQTIAEPVPLSATASVNGRPATIDGVPVVSAVTPDLAVVDRRVIKTGEQYNAWTLKRTDLGGGQTLWLDPSGLEHIIPLGVSGEESRGASPRFTRPTGSGPGPADPLPGGPTSEP